MPTAHTVRLYRAQLSSTDESERCGRAAFAVRHLSEMRLLITATGDLDATNARALGRFVERHTGVSKQLVLDLSDVEFFGTEGFAALHYVSVHCARHDVDWLFIGGRPVRRIVAICDPDAELPLADGLAAALARLDHLERCRHPVQSADRRPLQSDHGDSRPRPSRGDGNRVADRPTTRPFPILRRSARQRPSARTHTARMRERRQGEQPDSSTQVP